MQILYSYYKSEGSSLQSASKELQHSVDKSYEQYLLFLQIPLEVTRYASSVIERRKLKHIPSEEDLNPNTRFIDNKFVAQLDNSVMFNKLMVDIPVSWANNEDYIAKIYKVILESSIYKEYMEAPETSYDLDKTFWARVFKLVIYRSEELGDLLEEMSIYWNDDAELVISMVQKTVKSFVEKDGEKQRIMPLYKDKEDKEFAGKLLNRALRDGEDFKTRIDAKTEHWDSERVAFLDKLLMQIALAEIVAFPSIPVKVSINEYLDISKSYSTAKSATFINGVLDGVIKDMKKEDFFTKTGRGLIE